MLFCDTDELMQVPRFELEKSLRAALQVQETEASRGARSHHRTWTRSLPSHHHVIFAAEDYCFPAKMYQNVSGSARIKGWVAGNSAGASPTDSATAIYDSPICLNSGNYFGRPRAMIDLLNRTCMPCRRGLKVEHFQRHFHGSYTSLVPKGWFFDDQVEMAKIYVSGREEPQSTAPLLVGLDSQQRLFLPLSEWNAESILTPPKKVQIQRNGLFHSLASGTAPAFVHFNGPAKAWVGVHSASALLATLTQRYVSQTGDSQLNQLHQHVRDHVTFLDPDFHRVQGVSLSDVCSAGTSLESASATSSLKKMGQALQGSGSLG